MKSITLYTRPGCHLCEEAEDVLNQLQTQPEVKKINIENNAELEKKYGLRIPVIVNSTHTAEKGWPFGPEDIIELLKSHD